MFIKGEIDSVTFNSSQIESSWGHVELFFYQEQWNENLNEKCEKVLDLFKEGGQIEISINDDLTFKLRDDDVELFKIYAESFELLLNLYSVN